MLRGKFIILSLALFLLSYTGLFAEVYYWVDEAGKKHFSDSPPPKQDHHAIDGRKIDAAVSETEKKNPPSNMKGPALLDNLAYTGSSESLKNIQNSVLPIAKKGNLIAIHICRQTMYGIGELHLLTTLPLKAARNFGSDLISSWREKVEEKANQGDVFFITVLGVLYLEGHGVPVNHKQVLKLWRSAANQGYHDALCKLGNLYNSGDIVGIDIPTALSYYQKAGEGGSSTAIYNTAAIYFHGNGVKADRTKAFKLFLKAAQAGNVSAQRDLAYCYLKGYGTVADESKALHWFEEAAMKGDFRAKIEAAKLNKVSKDHPQNYYQVEICPSCLMGIFKDIRLCDVDILHDKLRHDSSLLNEQNSMGWTPLTLAIAAGCRDTVDLLLEKGVDVNEKHRQDGFTPLHLAAFLDRAEIITKLLKKAADINTTSTLPPPHMYWYSRMTGTPLHTAFLAKNDHLVELLLQNGADPNVKTPEGKTLFEFAVDLNRRSRITEIFKRNGIPVPQVAESVEELLSAIGDCNFVTTKQSGKEMVQKLLTENPQLVHAKDKNGTTPLHLAVFYNLPDLIKKFVAMGADVNAKENDGNTPLHDAVSEAKIAQFLIDQGAKVNETNDDGQTLLHVIAGNAEYDKAVEVIKTLIANGASKNIRNKNGRTPLDIAVSNSHFKLAAILK